MRKAAATIGVMCARERQPAEHEQRAERVEDVVDVEAVSRALMAAHPRQRAVEAVAEPVEREEEHDAPERGRYVARDGETHADQEHRDEPERR